MLRNRTFAWLLVFGSVAPGAAEAQPATALQVQTRSGMVEGVRDGTVLAFKGLPYAAPPVGALRWRAPQPARPWQGVRKARAFGKVCMQAPGAALAAGAGDIGPMGEDCLSLNVWTPATGAGKRPVMVWIHGGALVFGAGSQPL